MGSATAAGSQEGWPRKRVRTWGLKRVPMHIVHCKGSNKYAKGLSMGWSRGRRGPQGAAVAEWCSLAGRWPLDEFDA